MPVPDVPEEIVQVPTVSDFSAPAFELSSVSFAYASNSSPKTLDGINLVIPAGSRVAIVGPSGCGKSTLMKLMLSLLEQDTGGIRIFGTDTKSISRRQLRGLIAYVPQDSFLFPGSIRENLAWAREDEKQDEEAMQAACRVAGILSFIEELPDGFDTLLTESADNISGGQRAAFGRRAGTVSRRTDPAFGRGNLGSGPGHGTGTASSFQHLCCRKNRCCCCPSTCGSYFLRPNCRHE